MPFLEFRIRVRVRVRVSVRVRVRVSVRVRVRVSVRVTLRDRVGGITARRHNDTHLFRGHIDLTTLESGKILRDVLSNNRWPEAIQQN